MKVVSTVIAISSLVLFVSGCFSYREYPVEYDYSYHGKFKKYHTYAFLQNTGVSDTSVTNDIIEKVIKDRLAVQGYRYKDVKPNLLVSYKIYFDSLKFQGYDQPDIENWVKYSKTSLDYNKHAYT